MTDEQRDDLRTAIKDVHDRMHGLYPRHPAAAQPAEQRLRNQLLVVDLAMHLADEALGAVTPDEQRLVERTANLLYAIRLLAPSSPMERAAELLLSGITSGPATDDGQPAG
jgi:hypothetical protein